MDAVVSRETLVLIAGRSWPLATTVACRELAGHLEEPSQPSGSGCHPGTLASLAAAVTGEPVGPQPSPREPGPSPPGKRHAEPRVGVALARRDAEKQLRFAGFAVSDPAACFLTLCAPSPAQSPMGRGQSRALSGHPWCENAAKSPHRHVGGRPVSNRGTGVVAAGGQFAVTVLSALGVSSPGTVLLTQKFIL